MNKYLKSFFKQLIVFLTYLYNLFFDKVEPIDNFDPVLYQGVWKEYIRKKVSFQNEYQAIASYTIKESKSKSESNLIEVLNIQPTRPNKKITDVDKIISNLKTPTIIKQGITDDISYIIGEAEIATEWNKTNQKGTLWVNFDSATSFPAPYWIVKAFKGKLKPNEKETYVISVVSDPFKSTLWVLVRDGYQITNEQYNELFKFLAKFNGLYAYDLKSEAK